MTEVLRLFTFSSVGFNTSVPEQLRAQCSPLGSERETCWRAGVRGWIIFLFKATATKELRCIKVVFTKCFLLHDSQLLGNPSYITRTQKTHIQLPSSIESTASHLCISTYFIWTSTRIRSFAITPLRLQNFLSSGPIFNTETKII